MSAAAARPDDPDDGWSRGPAVPWPASVEQGVRWLGGAVVLLAVGLGALEGGFAAARWAPAGIALLWATVAAWWMAARGRPPRHVVVAFAAYGLLVVWTTASILWADVPGRALEASGRTLVYGLALAIAILPRWPGPSVRRLLVLLTAAVTVLALVTVVRILVADDPSSLFIGGRLIAPLGYVNATAGLWLIALGPAAHLAAGGVRSALGRVLALASVGVLLQVGLLSQSRGMLLAAVVAAVFMLLLTPRRGATLLVLAAVTVVSVLGAGTLLEVNGAPDIAELAARADRAVATIAWSTLALLVLGGAWQLLLRRLPAGQREVLIGRRLGDGAALAVAAVTLVVLVAAVGNPVSWVGDRVSSAVGSDGYANVAPSGNRLTGSLGSNRGDMYRVALRTFRDHPLTGIGAEDFQVAYLRERRSAEAPRYAHSFPLGVLSGIGIVGGVLWLVALGAPAWGAWRRRWRVGRETAAAVVAAATGFVAWFALSLVDWTWEFPALTILAFVLLGVASRVTDEPADGASDAAGGDPGAPSIRRRRWSRTALAAGTVAMLLTLTPILAAIGVGSHFQRAGTAVARTDPAGAMVALGRAARWNPLDADATLSRAIVARKAGDPGAWRGDLLRTLDRSPDDWFARLQLGMSLAAAGDRPAALEQMRRARDLNPGQPVVDEVIAAYRRGASPSPGAVEAAIASGLAQRLRPTGS